ncbi:MAG: hypothetical protein KJ767_01035, partial [Nanoarchaeota archaeon]|nr:hypothetical protein [Nanoarchaeota archaeon]
MKNIKKNLVKAGLISLLAITPLASASCNKEHNAFEGADAMYLDNDFNKETPDKKFKIEGDGKVYNLEINGIDYEPMTPEKAMETYEKQYLKNKRSQRIEEIVSEYSKYLQDDDEILMKRAMNSYVEAMEAEKKAQRSTPEIWEVSGKRYKEFIFTLNDYQKKYG